MVEIEFNNNNRDYLVRRGIKPNVFDIEVNGELLDKRGDDRDNQQTLEENILKVNYKSFTQIVILGSSTFVPFMQLSAAHRREVIEDLLDIRVFSSMSSIVKDKVRTIRDELKLLELKKTNLRDKGQLLAKFIEDITKRGEDDIQEKKDRIKKCMFEQAELNDNNGRILEEIEGLNKELEELQDAGEKLKKLGGLRGKIQQKISTLTKNHKFFSENAVCPTCTQDISEEMKDDKITELNKEAKKLKKGFADIESTIAAEEKREEEFTKTSKYLLQCNRQVSDNISSYTNLQKNIVSLESDIEKIRDSIDNQDDSKEKLKSTANNLNKIKDEITDLNVEMEKHKFIGDLLKGWWS